MSQSQEQFAHLQLIRKIASGGMGEVWEARDKGPHGFSKRLAVKKILPHLTEDEAFIRMFLDEGRLVAQLDHPNICQIFRMGQVSDLYYMEMEFVEGVVLTDLIDRASRRGVPIPLEHCCQIAIGVCAGLDYAHTREDEEGRSLGIIHRDVSPPNVMLSSEGYIKILDFGIAKARSRFHKTQPGLLKGKLGYVSPEQVYGQEIDLRSDVFSVGVVLWEMITSRRMFHADEELSVLKMIGEGKYKPPSMFREGLPPEFEWVVMKALAVRREERFQSCGEMQQALEDFLFRSGLPGGTRRLAQFVRQLMSDKPIDASLPSTPTAGSVSVAPALQTMPSMKMPNTPSNPPTISKAPPTDTPLRERKANRFQVLATDDEREILDAVKMILTSGGYDVELANDGLEAVEKVKARPYDVCLLDLDMPRLDGRGALEQIRQIQPSLPCIIQTGNDSFHMATEMGRRGAVTYLLKPARRKALLNAVHEALVHRPSGQAFEQIWLNDFPTPFAELRSKFRDLGDKESHTKARHALLSVQFELLTAWLGALAMAVYLRDGAFSSSLNKAFKSRAGQLDPDHWLASFRDILATYRESRRGFPFRALYELLTEATWSDDVGSQAIDKVMSTFSPLLSEPVAVVNERPWGAMQTLCLYHSEMWRHDALLDDREVSQRVEVLDRFLSLLFERTYRMIDFNIARVDGLSATDDGILHDLTIFRGTKPETRSFVFQESLDASGLYVFDLVGKPIVKLSPFLITSPRARADLASTALAFPVQLDPLSDLYYRCTNSGLLRRPGVLVQQSVKKLFEELA